jgi:D-alanyl-D-alanine carboxypeptidase
MKKLKKFGLLIVLAFVVFGVYWLNAAPNNKGVQGDEIPTRPPMTGSEPLDLFEPLDGSIFKPVNISDIPVTHHLKLINRTYPIKTDEAATGRLVSAWPTVAVGATDVTLHETALTAISELFAAAKGADAGSFFVSSGYRGVEEQRLLYDGAADKAFVMPPAHSEHHTGLAADILAVGVPQPSLGTSPQGKWLEANAWLFGLTLRYPADKQHITEVAYEPWHFRYVGKIHAWYMRVNDMVLEEYIGFVRESGGYSIEFDGLVYHILYQTPSDGIINVPYGFGFEVSVCNMGGYIVTAWGEVD